MMNLSSELQKYGIGKQSVRIFGNSATPELLDYLDLVKPAEQQALFPNGVAESQGRPLLFFVDESHPGIAPPNQETKLSELRRILACRGERAYLARVLPGELKVVPVGLDQRMPDWKIFTAGSGEALTFFSRLALGQYDGKGDQATTDYVFKVMFNLLKQVADRLASSIPPADVLSLVGRALFFRFLRDRRVIRDEDTKAIAPRATNLRGCFDTPEIAAATCHWLDRTFNGNFLPLTDNGRAKFFEDIARKTKDAVFNDLGAIVRGETPVGSKDYQLGFDWDDFDFGHIPIGLLSQVYEKFVWQWEHEEAKGTSVHYTPRNIAAILVDEAFEKLHDAHKSRVLDPACGAGVFLVLAFRRLYRELWKTTKHRPDTKSIRRILENQLTGFEISDSALKLSALSLYLTAIELDPEPIPPEKLRFKDLRNKVLFNCRGENDSEQGIVIGSLGPNIGSRFNARFDLVISNPPWTSLPKKEKSLAAKFTEVSKGVIRRMGEASKASAYQNPDNAPDLPFVWKSTEWCKPGGRIAMALPTRILLKQEDIPRNARHTIFRLIEVTGIINGSNLSDTDVWPEMQQPFMLMFARNRRPKLGHFVRFITPHCDNLLNQRGEVRIDSKSAQPVELNAAIEEPWLWKALAVGSSLDVEIVRRVKGIDARPLKAYWERDLGLVSRNGYQVKAEQTQQDASFLHGLPNLNDTELFHFVVEPEKLELFTRATVCWPRERKVYSAPLVLVKESPGINRENGWALLSYRDVAYDQSFYGYSAAGHPEGMLLVRYLHLLVHSRLWIYYALLTSPKFGAERRSVYKSVLDNFLVVPLTKLSHEQKQELLTLSDRLEHSDVTVFPEIDVFFGALYRLDKLDLEVIEDTLNVCLPYDEFRRRACQPPEIQDIDNFRRRLESLLRPFFRVMGKEPQVSPWNPANSAIGSKSPFSVLTVGVRGVPVALRDDILQRKILSLANETGATRTIQEAEGGLLIGILNQYRYWTPSRARLLAAEILREHTALFEE